MHCLSHSQSGQVRSGCTGSDEMALLAGTSVQRSHSHSGGRTDGYVGIYHSYVLTPIRCTQHRECITIQHITTQHNTYTYTFLLMSASQQGCTAGPTRDHSTQEVPMPHGTTAAQQLHAAPAMTAAPAMHAAPAMTAVPQPRIINTVHPTPPCATRCLAVQSSARTGIDGCILYSSLVSHQ